MKHVYRDGIDSSFDASLWQDYPLAGDAGMPEVLYLDRFRGERKQRPLSSHAHWEFIGTLEGSGELEAEPACELLPDRLLLVPPGVEHRESSGGRMELIWLGFNVKFAPEFPRGKPLALQSKRLVEELLELWRLSVGRYAQTGLELEGRLLTLIGGFWREFKERRSDGASRIRAAAKRFQDGCQASVNMAELASQLGLSERQFYRDFKRIMGQTPVNYLTELRLAKAALYLRETELPVAKIASLCGYSDPYYFCRLFAKRNGAPPSRFRQKRA